jgi:hypothetical protein
LYLKTTKSSENDKFYTIFVVSIGTKSGGKNGRKVEKKVFLSNYPGLKSEFFEAKNYLKNFIYAFKTQVQKFRKKYLFQFSFKSINML